MLHRRMLRCRASSDIDAGYEPLDFQAICPQLSLRGFPASSSRGIPTKSERTKLRDFAFCQFAKQFKRHRCWLDPESCCIGRLPVWVAFNRIGVVKSSGLDRLHLRSIAFIDLFEGQGRNILEPCDSQAV